MVRKRNPNYRVVEYEEDVYTDEEDYYPRKSYRRRRRPHTKVVEEVVERPV